MSTIVSSGISVIVGSVIGALVTMLTKQYKTEIAMRKATRYLLKDRITQACQHWLTVGYCPIHNREVLQEMTQSYHENGGNSFVSDLVETTLDLPLGDATDGRL